jgi:prophage endopeptidase
MTPTQWKLPLQVAAGLTLIAILCASSFACAWYWQENSYQRQLAAQSTSYQADLLNITNAGAAQNRRALERQQAAEAHAAAVDTQYTKEKLDAIAQNEILRRAVADGARRLRIAGTCAANGDSRSNLPGTASAAGLGDAGAVELSGAAGRAVFDIRAGIIADRKALKALQLYTEGCSKIFEGIAYSSDPLVH